MDGKVEVSILQWEAQRKELEGLKLKVETYKEQSKQVKLTVVEKRMSGHLQYNRYNDRNDYVKDDQTVENVQYVGMEDIKRIMKEEAQDEVREDINKLESDKSNLVSEVRTLKKVHDNNNKELRSSYDDKLDTIKDEHKEVVDKLEDELSTTTHKHVKEIERLQGVIDGKKEEKKEITEVQELISQIGVLKKHNEKLYEKLPWWKK